MKKKIPVYTKKPIKVEAVRLCPANITDVSRWSKSPYIIEGKKRVGLIIYTLEGQMKAWMGDFVVKGIKGEFYPVREDIFRETYEEAK